MKSNGKNICFSLIVFKTKFCSYRHLKKNRFFEYFKKVGREQDVVKRDMIGEMNKEDLTENYMKKYA